VDPRKLVGYVLVAALVGVLAVSYVRAVRPATAREKTSTCGALAPTATSPVLGTFPRPAPEVTAQDYTGKMVSLSAYRGRVVLLNFWASWCPPCVQEVPSMDALQRTFARAPFTILALASEPSWDKVRGFFPSGSSMTVLLDPPAGDENIGALSLSYGTRQLPETYVIDKRGHIRYYIVNQRDWTEPRVLQCLRALIDE